MPAGLSVALTRGGQKQTRGAEEFAAAYYEIPAIEQSLLVRMRRSESGLTSELLTRLPWETTQNHLNGEADDAISFCIVAVSPGLSSCT